MRIATERGELLWLIGNELPGEAVDLDLARLLRGCDLRSLVHDPDPGGLGVDVPLPFGSPSAGRNLLIACLLACSTPGRGVVEPIVALRGTTMVLAASPAPLPTHA